MVTYEIFNFVFFSIAVCCVLTLSIYLLASTQIVRPHSFASTCKCPAICFSRIRLFACHLKSTHLFRSAKQNVLVLS